MLTVGLKASSWGALPAEAEEAEELRRRHRGAWGKLLALASVGSLLTLISRRPPQTEPGQTDRRFALGTTQEQKRRGPISTARIAIYGFLCVGSGGHAAK